MPNQVQTLMDLDFCPGQASRICEPVATQGAAAQASEKIGASAGQGQSGGKHVAGRRSQEVRLRSGSRGGGEESGVATAASAGPG